MKIIVTGAEGQLGHDVKKIMSQNNHEVFAFGRKDLDITSNDSVLQTITELKPDVIVHCAAYTNVDKAEDDKEMAYKVNAEGTKFIAEAAERVGAKVAYISTDYVFDGSAETPYEVKDQKSPLGVYGDSKSRGEDYIQEISSKYYIIRTAWVYGSNGKNFVKTMLNLADEHTELKIVNDQKGSPTYTYDLAKLILVLSSTEDYGIYHGTNSGECTWYDFAKEIFEIKHLNIKVNPCSTKEFPRPAPRPKYSVLGSKSLSYIDVEPLRHWKDALREYLLNEETYETSNSSNCNLQ